MKSQEEEHDTTRVRETEQSRSQDPTRGSRSNARSKEATWVAESDPHQKDPHSSGKKEDSN